MSPDGQTIVTGAGDETLRFWNVFYKSRSHKVVMGGLGKACCNLLAPSHMKEACSPLNMAVYIR